MDIEVVHFAPDGLSKEVWKFNSPYYATITLRSYTRFERPSRRHKYRAVAYAADPNHWQHKRETPISDAVPGGAEIFAEAKVNLIERIVINSQIDGFKVYPYRGDY